jgi:hypothetical protein
VHPDFNVAGVDYGVGIPPSNVATLKDPATAALPVGCGYSATGNVGKYPAVTCNFWGQTAAVSLDFDNFDWSANANHGPVCLNLVNLPAVGGEIIITRSKFVADNGANANAQYCQGGTSDAPAFVYISAYAPVGFFFAYNDVQAGVPLLPVQMNVAEGTTYGPITIQYNAIRNTGGKPFQFGGALGGATSQPGDVVVTHNLMSAWDQYPNGIHAETFQINGVNGGNLGSVVMQNMTIEYNTVMQSAYGTMAGNAAAAFWPGLGPYATADGGSTIVNTKIEHNVVVSNSFGGAGGPANAAFTLAEFAWGASTNVTITDNWLDDTGAAYGPVACSAGPESSGMNLGPSSPIIANLSISGNMDLLTGQPETQLPGFHDYWNGTIFNQSPAVCSVQ